jgi:hypothetical protein
MQIGFKYYNCRGFGTLYNDAIKQKYMITKEANKVYIFNIHNTSLEPI